MVLATSSSADIRLSVVIPAHDAATVLPAQLDALMRQNDDDYWEVLVVDNASRDGTAELVARYAEIYPRIRLLRANAKANVSYARNEGVRAARGRSIAFVDADDVVAAGWLEAMDALLARHEFVVGPLEYGRLNPAWAVEVRGAGQRDDFFYVEGGPPWPIAFAANMGIARVRHEQIGGFDEALAWGGEDADYTWRLHHVGVFPVWAPDAVVHYRLRRNLLAMYRQSVGYARSRWELHRRFSASWPVAPRAMTKVQLVIQSVLHLRRARSRVGVAQWLWQLGWSVGDREGARIEDRLHTRS